MFHCYEEYCYHSCSCSAAINRCALGQPSFLCLDVIDLHNAPKREQPYSVGGVGPKQTEVGMEGYEDSIAG